MSSSTKFANGNVIQEPPAAQDQIYPGARHLCRAGRTGGRLGHYRYRYIGHHVSLDSHVQWLGQAGGSLLMDGRLIEMVRDEADSPLWGALEITEDTDLCIDLEISDRAMLRLMRRFSETFGVDISDFDIDYYYPSRKLGMGRFLMTVFRSPFSADARDKILERPLTIKMMETAIETGRWTM
nr:MULTISPECIES: DUF1493 family protein [Burkholderia]